MELIIKLNRRIYSKKNSRRVIYRGQRMFFVPSRSFEKFANFAKVDIYDQMGRVLNEPYFTGPVRVHTDIFIPGRTRVDGDNLHTSLLDVLEAAKVIADDNNVMRGSYQKHPGSSSWGARILIEDL